MCHEKVFCHTSRNYIYLIKSLPAVKRISLLQFFYILILLRQKVYKVLLFEEKSCKVQGASYKYEESVVITEGLKLIIFTYKWGKCVKHVEKYLLESLAK